MRLPLGWLSDPVLAGGPPARPLVVVLKSPGPQFLPQANKAVTVSKVSKLVSGVKHKKLAAGLHHITGMFRKSRGQKRNRPSVRELAQFLTLERFPFLQCVTAFQEEETRRLSAYLCTHFRNWCCYLTTSFSH
ncbi:hypothetical protein J6590_000853 [Homalodisca vitripennis]|nr:hypothetical protein J6590_000853 [Homalodisca vitripennis]